MSCAQNFLATGKAVQADVARLLGPPEEGLRSATQSVIPLSVVRNTRGYIERVVNQINGTYEKGWYDACAVMIRRLMETLIIEAFEHHKLEAKIKNGTGDFLHLRDLVDRCLQETAWNLNRTCKQTMPRLKDIGDNSAHSRRYLAHRHDIEPLLPGIRQVVQELVHIAGRK